MNESVMQEIFKIGRELNSLNEFYRYANEMDRRASLVKCVKYWDEILSRTTQVPNEPDSSNELDISNDMEIEKNTKRKQNLESPLLKKKMKHD